MTEDNRPRGALGEVVLQDRDHITALEPREYSKLSAKL